MNATNDAAQARYRTRKAQSQTRVNQRPQMANRPWREEIGTVEQRAICDAMSRILRDIDKTLQQRFDADQFLSEVDRELLDEYRVALKDFESTRPPGILLTVSAEELLVGSQVDLLERIALGKTAATESPAALAEVRAALWGTHPTSVPIRKELMEGNHTLTQLRELLDLCATWQSLDTFTAIQEKLVIRLVRSGVIKPRSTAGGAEVRLTPEGLSQWKERREQFDIDWLLRVVTEENIGANTLGVVHAAVTTSTRLRKKDTRPKPVQRAAVKAAVTAIGGGATPKLVAQWLRTNDASMRRETMLEIMREPDIVKLLTKQPKQSRKAKG